MSSASSFAEQLEAILGGYVEEVAEVVKEQVDATAEEVNASIKSKAPRDVYKRQTIRNHWMQMG